MEKGDRFVSKKTIEELNFIKSETYEYRGNINNTVYFAHVGNDKIIPLGITFNEFFEFFYTEKEVRKLKLDKINEKEL